MTRKTPRTTIVKPAWHILIPKAGVSKAMQFLSTHRSLTHAVRAPRLTAYIMSRLMIESVLPGRKSTRRSEGLGEAHWHDTHLLNPVLFELR